MGGTDADKKLSSDGDGVVNKKQYYNNNINKISLSTTPICSLLQRVATKPDRRHWRHQPFPTIQQQQQQHSYSQWHHRRTSERRYNASNAYH